VNPWAAVVLAVVGSSGLGAWVKAKFPAKASPLEVLAQVKQEREDDRVKIENLQSDMRKLTDYVHDLREHIAEGKPPPPPDWPDGLRV
jgi:hypothetical protein